jgi:hypothetical protein
MDNLTHSKNLKERLETYLDRACQAEAAGNSVEAERQFKFAAYCEGLSRPDVGNAREYVRQIGPVYGNSQRRSDPAIQEKNHEQR